MGWRVLVAVAVVLVLGTAVAVEEKGQEQDLQQQQPGSLRRRRVEGSAVVTPEPRGSKDSTRRSTQRGGFFTLGNNRTVTVTPATTTTSAEVVENAESGGDGRGNSGSDFEPVMGTVGFSLPPMIVSLLMDLRPRENESGNESGNTGDSSQPTSGNDAGNRETEIPEEMIMLPESLSMMSGFMRPPSPCVPQQEIVTFETDATGAELSGGMLINDTVKFAGGVSFAARTVQDARARRFDFDDGMLFDAGMDPSLTRDADLVANPQQGNMLIIAKKRILTPNNPVPDDNGQGGLLRGTFDSEATLHFITLVDVEEGGATVQLFGPDDSRTPFKEMSLPPGNDGDARVMPINESGVSRFVIKITGSGALDDVVFSRPCTSAP